MSIDTSPLPSLPFNIGPAVPIREDEHSYLTVLFATYFRGLTEDALLHAKRIVTFLVGHGERPAALALAVCLSQREIRFANVEAVAFVKAAIWSAVHHDTTCAYTSRHLAGSVWVGTLRDSLDVLLGSEIQLYKPNRTEGVFSSHPTGLPLAEDGTLVLYVAPFRVTSTGGYVRVFVVSASGTLEAVKSEGMRETKAGGLVRWAHYIPGAGLSYADAVADRIAAEAKLDRRLVTVVEM